MREKAGERPRTTQASLHRGGRKRICMVAYSEIVADPRILQEARALVASGWEIDIIGVRPAGSAAVDSPAIRLHFVPIGTRRGGKLRYLYQYGLFLLVSTALLVSLQVRRRFAVVHVHSLPDFQVACALPLRALGVHVVLDLHESMPEIVRARFRLPRTSRWVRAAVAAERMSCRLADRVIASNPAIAQLAIDRGADAARVEVVYSIGRVETSPDPETVRQRLNLRGSSFLVHAGGINPERDLETLIAATAFVSQSFPVRLVLAGSGDARYIEQLRQTSRTLGIGDSVEFVGQVPIEEAQALVAIAKVGVVTLQANPLTEIALPNRVLEFARLGKPLVLPDLALLRRLFEGGAYFYRPGSAVDLAGRIREAWSDDGSSARAKRATTVARSISGPGLAKRLAGVYAALGA